MGSGARQISRRAGGLPGGTGMNQTTPNRNPNLDPLALPLNGSALIEASAGTGKTFTIAILYVRLVLRSEEHTSELQSRENLVCRLLLEKKKHILSALIEDRVHQQ